MSFLINTSIIRLDMIFSDWYKGTGNGCLPFSCNLSAAYEAWDRMDLNEACEKMAICLDTLKDKDLSAFGDYKKHIEVLEGQFETLRLT